jgi:uncharacterized protein (UPF0276 family)
VQYAPDGEYLLPTVSDLSAYRTEFFKVKQIASPPLVSLHFGPAARRIRIVEDLFLVAEGPLLSEEQIGENLGRNLQLLKEIFPESGLLIENMEYIPDSMSGGACGRIAEPSFFSRHALDWHAENMIDGIVFDIAHALITSGNHPDFAGSGNLLDCFARYIDRMPLHLARELHISGIKKMDGGPYLDAHQVVGDMELRALAMVLEALEGVPRLSITIEHHTSVPSLIDAIRKMALK